MSALTLLARTTRRSVHTPSGFVRCVATSSPNLPPPAGPRPPHLLTLADLNVQQIQTLITSACEFKAAVKAEAIPVSARAKDGSSTKGALKPVVKTLENKTVALIFNKRSTRTRVATETSVKLLGGHPMFLGSADIQLGVNESLYDTARVVSSMVDGIMARVGDHADVEDLARNSSVPVINALSSLYHPTQILADIQTLLEAKSTTTALSSLKGLTISWVGDSNNILNEMIVTYPRLGINLQIATPVGYALDPIIMERARKGLEEEGGAGKIMHTHSPEEAVKGADVVTTDTWISMGQEDEQARRLADFAGFQITADLLKRGGAKPDCLFMHCLPRHSYEVDDEVFYGKQSVVFPEAENRKWTIMATMDAFVGKWKV